MWHHIYHTVSEFVSVPERPQRPIALNKKSVRKKRTYWMTVTNEHHCTFRLNPESI